MESTRRPGRPAGTSAARTGSASAGNVTGFSAAPSLPLTGFRRTETESPEQSGPSKRPRKERGPNWSALEISALIDAKRKLAEEEADTADGRLLMTPETGKWKRISADVMHAGHSPCLRDGPACKGKWSQIFPDYKRIADFFSHTGTNSMEYWELSTSQRKEQGLPRTFPQNVFFQIHQWCGQRPSITPLRTLDFMADEADDRRPPLTSNADDEGLPDSDKEDAVAVAAAMEQSDDASASTLSPLPASEAGKDRPTTALGGTMQSGGNVTLPKGCLPPGVTPYVVSSSNTAAASVPRSSDTGEATAARRPPNTVVRRKSIAGHSLIAEATRATGDAMATQMREMAEGSRELEQCRIDVQQRIFEAQMQYQRERDQRLQDNARIANDNAKLAIEKQGQVVLCLAQLSAALSAGLQFRHAPPAQGGEASVGQTRQPAAPEEDQGVSEVFKSAAH